MIGSSPLILFDLQAQNKVATAIESKRIFFIFILRINMEYKVCNAKLLKNNIVYKTNVQEKGYKKKSKNNQIFN